MTRLRQGISPAERSSLLGRGDDPELQSEQETELRGLRRLLRVSRRLNSLVERDALFTAVLDEAIDLVSAGRGVLLLLEGGAFRTLLARSDARESIDVDSVQVTETLVRQSIERHRVIKWDALDHAYESGPTQSMTALDLSQVVCVPLQCDDRPFGVLYLDSRARRMLSGRLEEELLEAFAAQAAVALQNSQLILDLEDSKESLRRENHSLRARAGEPRFVDRMIGETPAMQALRERVASLADLPISVVVRGESGVGKELVAEALHRDGRYRDAPFVRMNCTELAQSLAEAQLFGYKRGAFTGAVQDTPGFLDRADGGTLFLDEIGELSIEIQAKLLRFLESGLYHRLGETTEREARVRVISATHRDLETLVHEGRFRQDLFFRVRGIQVVVPTLRDRLEDLPLLVDHLLKSVSANMGRRVDRVTPAALTLMKNYSWPGNVRELRRVLEAGCATVGDSVQLDVDEILPHLDPTLRSRTPSASAPGPVRRLEDAIRDAERELITGALEQTQGNITHAARALGISRQHLHTRIRLHGIPAAVRRTGLVVNTRQ